MNKILTVSVAAYNIQNFVTNTLDSLLVNGIDDVEILVNNDGGSDNTVNIAKQYEIKYPGIIKVIEKENGGYGSTINYGIDHAKGKYFKQLDGDDWYDKDGFIKLLETLRKNDADVFYTPYTIYNESINSIEKRDTMSQVSTGIHDINAVINKHQLLWMNMYTLAYRTELLRKCNVRLIEKCLYTDTIYSLIPITFAGDIYISHDCVYCYRIGRDEQSVSKNSKMKHYGDHMKVSYYLAEYYSKNKNCLSIPIKKYYEYYASGMLSITINEFLVLQQNGKQLVDEYLDEIKHIDTDLYKLVISKRKIFLLYVFLGRKPYNLLKNRLQS